MELTRASLRVSYVGHGTVLLDLDGVRVLTDPILRHRVGPLRRRGPGPDLTLLQGLDAVAISHVHLDHFDPPSLRLVDPDTLLFVPRGVGAVARRLGFTRIHELRAGDTACVGALDVTAVHAAHTVARLPGGLAAECLGYVFRGSHTVYFAGDTGLVAEMAGLADPLDVALLPVWGWGPRLGDEHLTPYGAAESLRLLRSTVAVPIHWGTLFPLGFGWMRPSFLVYPPYAFVHHAARVAPEVTVEVVAPGAELVL